jgi:hypothetical protein
LLQRACELYRKGEEEEVAQSRSEAALGSSLL